VEIIPKSQNRIDLVFNEEISPLLDSFHQFILFSQRDTLPILIITQELKNDFVSLYTKDLIFNEQYEIRGWVVDKVGNITKIKKKFMSRFQFDTFPPRVISINPKPLSTLKNVARLTIEIKFSEPLNPQNPLLFFLSPFSRANVQYQFDADYKTLYFTVDDPLVKDYHGIVSFILYPTVTDLANNQLKTLVSTCFVLDTVLPNFIVRGQTYYQQKPLPGAIVVFLKDHLKLYETSQKDGTFVLPLEPGPYLIQAVADTNYDRLVDLISSSQEIVLDSLMEVFIDLLPVKDALKIDDYLN
jgi:hypothetical protein